MADRVRTHTRKTASGKTATVRNHTRAGRPKKAIVHPRHAWKLAKKAWSANRKKKRTAAVILSLLALTEITAWLTLEGVSLAFATAGILALSVAAVGAAAGGLHK